VIIDAEINGTALRATTFSRLNTPFGTEMQTQEQIIRPHLDSPGEFEILIAGAPHPTPCKCHEIVKV